ncbi:MULTISPECIES: nitroreductase/quinone reductase family protein [Streptomyces]|uniref:nitroreductase/quinone reductase family protein n=1 Tax=Streptomyces TaxID=1883 RepID=UPI002F9280E7
MSATDFNQWVIDEFRANGGKVGGPFEGSDLLLLTTTGARTGRQHTTPLGRIPHEEGLLVVGSNLGADRHPAWYHNLLAHPLVRVETAAEEYEAVAVPAEGAHRERLFAYVAAAEPGYADYQDRTSRTLPVVVLQRSDPAPGEGPSEVRTLADKLLEVHVWLRGQLRHVHAETEALFAARAQAARQGAAPPAAPGLGLQIRQHCLAFCQALEFHHKGEDAHVFPALAAAHPHLEDAFARLAAEHRTVARIQQELGLLLADAATADPDRFRGELARLSVELTAHLDYEEQQVLPLLAEIPFPPGRPA